MDALTISNDASSIFSLPEVVFRINDLINSDNATNFELEQTVLADPALTAKILKFANSSYFGFPKRVGTASNAISIIGHKELRNLVMAASVASTFKGIPPDLVDMDTFWCNSVTCGIVARLLATSLATKERFFIAGLLHSVGKLILFNQFPLESAQILSQMNEGERTAAKAEYKMFGFTNVQLGTELLKNWHLPSNIWKVVEYQLNPSKAGDYKEDASILCAAVHIANHIQPCTNQIAGSDAKSIDILGDWNHIGLTQEIIELTATVAKLQVIEIMNIIRS